MLSNNNIYKGNDIDNKNILNNYFNPYEYNIESTLKNNNLNNNKVKSNLHSKRGKKYS